MGKIIPVFPRQNVVGCALFNKFGDMKEQIWPPYRLLRKKNRQLSHFLVTGRIGHLKIRGEAYEKSVA